MQLQTLKNFNCLNHPSREGVGICMAGCRQVFCEECSTKIDGINTCLGCLKRKVNKTGSKKSSFGRHINAFAGLLALLCAVVMLVLSVYQWGVFIPGSESSALGNRIFLNMAILDALAEGIGDFGRDVGRFPSSDEGFRALIWDEELGEAPEGFDPDASYWPGEYSMVEIKTRQGVPLDAYGTPLRYISAPDLPAAIVLSAGADKVFETDTQDLIALVRQADPDLPVVPEGDDMLATAER